MPKKIDLSVIIPLYNSQQTIIKCIESVVTSCLQGEIIWEIIIINDGSTDNSYQVVKSYIESSPHSTQIHLYTQSNGGVSKARNEGIMRSKGNYIAFNDSDDYWVGEKIKSQFVILNSFNHIELLAAQYDTDNISVIKNIKDLTNITIKDQSFRNYFAAQTAVIKSSILEQTGLFNESMRYAEDANFFNKIVCRGNAYLQNSCFAHPIITKHRWGDSGLSSNLKEMERGELQNIEELFFNKHISLPIYILAIIFSFLKFIRRIILSLLFRINRKSI